MRKRRHRGRGPSRWWRAAEAVAKVCAGVALLGGVHAVLTYWTPPDSVWRALGAGAGWFVVAAAAAVLGRVCAQRSLALELDPVLRSRDPTDHR